MADNYGLQRWIQGRDQFQALAEREGILPRGLARPESISDPNDFTNRYNTQLSPREEALFQDWLSTTGRQGDLYDYDLRGAWKSGDVFKLDGRGHLPDTYKKPNHPTFSNESQYSGQDGFVGGHWSELPNGKYVFTTGNSPMISKEGLQGYFTRNEPSAVLMDNRPGSYYNEDIGEAIIHLNPSNTNSGFLNYLTNMANQLSNRVRDNKSTSLPLASTGPRG